jgi:hypothetical protein
VSIRILNSVLLGIGAAAIGLAADLIFQRPSWTYVQGRLQSLFALPVGGGDVAVGMRKRHMHPQIAA